MQVGYKYVGAAKVKKEHHRHHTAQNTIDSTAKGNADMVFDKDKSANSHSSKFDDEYEHHRESKVDVGLLFGFSLLDDTAAKDSSMTIDNSHNAHLKEEAVAV